MNERSLVKQRLFMEFMNVSGIGDKLAKACADRAINYLDELVELHGNKELGVNENDGDNPLYQFPWKEFDKAAGQRIDKITITSDSTGIMVFGVLGKTSLHSCNDPACYTSVVDYDLIPDYFKDEKFDGHKIERPDDV